MRKSSLKLKKKRGCARTLVDMIWKLFIDIPKLEKQNHCYHIYDQGNSVFAYLDLTGALLSLAWSKSERKLHICTFIHISPAKQIS